VVKRVVVGLLGMVAVLGLLALGGCGGSDNSSSTAAVTVESSSISKASFLKQAEAICVKGITPVEAIVQKAIVGKGNVKQVEKAVLPAIEGFVREIAALGAPEGEEEKVESFLTALKEDVESAKAAPSNSMGQLAKHFKTSGDLARSYGLEACALG
jgi:hypothetical protein